MLTITMMNPVGGNVMRSNSNVARANFNQRDGRYVFSSMKAALVSRLGNKIAGDPNQVAPGNLASSRFGAIESTPTREPLPISIPEGTTPLFPTKALRPIFTGDTVIQPRSMCGE